MLLSSPPQICVLLISPSCSALSRSRPRLDRLVLPLSFLLSLFASWCIGQALLVCVPLLLACPRCLGLVSVPSVPTTTSPYHVTTHYPLPRARYGRDGPPRSLLSIPIVFICHCVKCFHLFFIFFSLAVFAVADRWVPALHTHTCFILPEIRG